jgi:hypothetical protein
MTRHGKPTPALSAKPAKEPGLLASSLRYYPLRIAAFAAMFAAMLALGLDWVLALFLAFVVSGIMSFPLALRQRHAVQRAYENRKARG